MRKYRRHDAGFSVEGMANAIFEDLDDTRVSHNSTSFGDTAESVMSCKASYELLLGEAADSSKAKTTSVARAEKTDADSNGVLSWTNGWNAKES